MKSKNLTSLKLNMMMPSIFTAGSTGEMANFEKATGIGVNYFEVGILQIQAKAMSEAVAKSGSFDFWIGDPISLPDLVEAGLVRPIDDLAARGKPDLDRKSTRLNSSHGYISYAVFCLKKKKKNQNHQYKQHKKHMNL